MENVDIKALLKEAEKKYMSEANDFMKRFIVATEISDSLFHEANYVHR